MLGISYYDFAVNDIDGEEVKLEEYEGKVLLIVHVASKCGFTPQYKGLQALYEKYQPEGFVVLGFPANNFMGQEPGSNEESKQFCSLTYGVTFPMFSKISVIGRDGTILNRFGSKDNPGSEKVVQAIEEALEALALSLPDAKAIEEENRPAVALKELQGIGEPNSPSHFRSPAHAVSTCLPRDDGDLSPFGLEGRAPLGLQRLGRDERVQTPDQTRRTVPPVPLPRAHQRVQPAMQRVLD